MHAPVADSTLLLKAAEGLVRLVTSAERLERFVWTVTDHPRLHAHPDRLAHLLGRHAGGARLVAH
ncbi:MAG: hypothetical protein U1F67_02890 [Rubrivivax sp.]